MKNVILIFVILGILLLGGCSASTVENLKKEAYDKTENVADKDNKYVSMVKNGNLVDYPNESFGDCFQNFFASPTWKHYKTDKNVNIVEFTGECTYQKVPVKARIQFVIDEENNSFEVGYLSFNEVPQDSITTNVLLTTVFENDQKPIQGKINSENNENNVLMDYISPNHVEASSELVESNQSDYIAQNTIDSLKETAWVEGVSGNGKGEWILFEWDSQKEINEIKILSGYYKNKNLYFENNRVKKIGMEFSDGSYMEADLNDNFGLENIITLKEPVKASSVKLTILEVYKGTKYEDTCISDIKFIGR